MFDKDLVFVLLVGLALGLGKVATRLEPRALLIISGMLLLFVPLLVAAYTAVYEASTFTLLVWLAASLAAGILSSRLVAPSREPQERR